jgi:uncharacterized protein
MLIYADGSAIARSIGVDPEFEAWSKFAAQAVGRLVTSQLGLAEARRIAAPFGFSAREVIRNTADQVTVLRMSDQAAKLAARVSVAAPADASVHMGIVLSNTDVDTVATYDLLLARLAAIYGLTVAAPGRPDSWWEG